MPVVYRAAPGTVENMRILLVGRFEPVLVSALQGHDDLVELPDAPRREAFLAEHGAGIGAIVRSGKGAVDAALLAGLPNLEVIVNNSAGVDAVDVTEARRRGIAVSNTPDVLTDSTADTALGLILMTLRCFGAAERYLRAGRWERDGDFPYGRDVSGLRVGILGLGRIGSAIAARLGGFDCAIAYHNRHRIPGSPYRYADSPYELAESVDLLVVSTAGGRGTDQLVDREVLKALGPQGYLVNIARGSVVDQDALVELLVSGGLAGAGLDVYAEEPRVPAELCELDNVVLLPHVGSATRRTRAAMARLAVRNLDSFLATGRLLTPVPAPNSAPGQ